MASRLGRIPATWWAKSAASGLVGGVVMELAWNIGSAIQGRGFWTPMNAIGTTMPGADTVTGNFSAVTISGSFIHLLTSLCWGIVFGVLMGLVVPRFMSTVGRATLGGLIFGVGVFVIMGLIVGPLVDPRITTIHPVNYFIGHLVFGAVTGWALYTMARRRELGVTFAPEVAVTRRTTTLHR